MVLLSSKISVCAQAEHVMFVRSPSFLGPSRLCRELLLSEPSPWVLLNGFLNVAKVLLIFLVMFFYHFREKIRSAMGTNRQHQTIY